MQYATPNQTVLPAVYGHGESKHIVRFTRISNCHGDPGHTVDVSPVEPTLRDMLGNHWQVKPPRTSRPS
jgi:hypothetical protein